MNDQLEETAQMVVECWNKKETHIKQILEVKQKPMEQEENPISGSLKDYIKHYDRSGLCLQEFKIDCTRDQLPLSTTYYVRLNQNVRIVDPVPLIYANLTPYSIQVNSTQSYQDNLWFTVEDIQRKNKQYFSPADEVFVQTLCEQMLQDGVKGYDALFKIRSISKVLRKHPQQLLSKFAEMFKHKLSNKSSSIHQKSRPKHYFFGSNDDYCNICHLFTCSTHFPQQGRVMNERYDPEQSDHLHTKTSSPYESRSKPNKDALTRISNDASQVDYQCQDQSGCYRVQIQQNNPNQKLKKFQAHWIQMLCGYGLTNPCLIYKAVRNKEYPITCSQIRDYMVKNKDQLQPFSRKQESTQTVKCRQTVDPKNSKHAHRDDMLLPCFHDGTCGTSDCNCTRCYKFCCCPPSCSKRVGCHCNDCGLMDNTGKYLCPCRFKKIECDPDVCGCPVKEQAPKSRVRYARDLKCVNSPITFNVTPRLVLSKSLICEGLGVFAGQPFEKFDFVGEYRGAILDEAQSAIAEQLDQLTGQHYLFVLNAEEQVDGKRFGNKTRFVNHALPPVANCDCQVNVVKGTFKVMMFANRSIQLGEELFFDYSEEFKTDWKLAFDKRSQQYFKQKR